MQTIGRFKSWIFLTAFPVLIFGDLSGPRYTAMARALHDSELKIKTKDHDEHSQEQHKRTITIFIHGTTGRAQILPIQAVAHRFKCKQGLHHWTATGEEFHLRQKASLLIESDPSRFDPEDFYLFGWSGKLSFQARED